MDDLFLTALAAVSGKMAKATPTLAPGEYAIDETVTLRIAGTVNKGEDESYRPTISVPVKALAAALLARMGATREAAIGMLVECITEALNKGGKANDTLSERMKDVEAAFETVNERVLAQLPPQTRSGKTRVDCTVVAVPTATATVNVP